MSRGRTVLAQQVYEDIRLRVIEGRIPPGDRLTEARLAEDLNVSRTPIREALGRLESEGLAVRDGASLAAAQFDPTSAAELLLLRELIEPRCALESAPRLEQADIARLQATLTEMEAVRLSKLATSRSAALNIQFHDVLYSKCPYVLLLEEVRRVREQFVTYWLYAHYDDYEMERADLDHLEMAEIAQGVVSGSSKPEDLSELVRKHIVTAREKVLASS